MIKILYALIFVLFIPTIIDLVSRLRKFSVKSPAIEVSGELDKHVGGNSISHWFKSPTARQVLLSQMLVFASLFIFIPTISKQICRFSSKYIEKSIKIKVVQERNGILLPVSNARIELNGDATDPETDLGGITDLKYSLKCSWYPGCDCPKKVKMNFVVIYGKKDDPETFEKLEFWDVENLLKLDQSQIFQLNIK